MVPLPPIGILPKRRNGTVKVTTLGVTSRMTITSDGLAGISVDDMLFWLLLMLKIATELPRRMAPVKSRFFVR